MSVQLPLLAVTTPIVRPCALVPSVVLLADSEMKDVVMLFVEIMELKVAVLSPSSA